MSVARAARLGAVLPIPLLLAIALLSSIGAPSGAAAVEPSKELGNVNAVRTWSYPDYTRVVVELSRRVATEVHRLPARSELRERLYLDLDGIRLGAESEKRVEVGDGLLHAVRLGQNTSERARVVIDLDRYDRHRLLVLRAPDRIVVDIYGAPASRPSARSPSASTPRLPLDLRRVRTVVLDPGHGGRDPGATSRGGLLEKDVTLRLAQALRPRLEEAGFRVLLTRNGDDSRSLEERTAIAEGSGGDVFVSLHANAARRRGAHGIETYYLDEAHERHTLRLAAIENGVSPRELDQLQRTLASLRVSEVSELSSELARNVHEELLAGLSQRYRGVQDLGVKRGPFHVLFLSTMPAILVETGFLTHRAEARRLASREYLDLIAERITAGLNRYRSQRDLLFAGGHP